MKKLYFLFLATALSFFPTTLFAAELSNPLQTTNIRAVIARLIQAILGITGSIALLMFVYGGFLFLISSGSPKLVEKGKEIMKWAVLGLVVIIGAYMIVSTIVGALEVSVAGE